jgi:hypothetical protein
MPLRLLKLRWTTACSACGKAQPAGASAWWDSGTRKVTCLPCLAARAEPAPSAWESGRARDSLTPEFQRSPRRELDRGVAAASVGREYRRRKYNREIRTMRAHPRLGRFLLALRGAPWHERAWRAGELGEIEVAASLERGVMEPAIVLHDRRMPGGYGNIDHLVVARSGVFVVDAKGLRGRVRVSTPLLGAPRLMVAGRDRTKLIDGLDRQVETVREALARAGHRAVPVRGAMCFTSAHLPLLGTPRLRGHLLVRREPLVRLLNAQGSLGQDTIELLACTLAAALPSA